MFQDLLAENLDILLEKGGIIFLLEDESSNGYHLVKKLILLVEKLKGHTENVSC